MADLGGQGLGFGQPRGPWGGAAAGLAIGDREVFFRAETGVLGVGNGVERQLFGTVLLGKPVTGSIRRLPELPTCAADFHQVKPGALQRGLTGLSLPVGVGKTLVIPVVGGLPSLRFGLPVISRLA